MASLTVGMMPYFQYQFSCYTKSFFIIPLPQSVSPSHTSAAGLWITSSTDSVRVTSLLLAYFIHSGSPQDQALASDEL